MLTIRHVKKTRVNGMGAHGLRSASVAASGAVADGSTAIAAIMTSNSVKTFHCAFQRSIARAHIVMRRRCLCGGATDAN